MEVKAKLRFLHMSPRKVRLVVNAVRGMQVDKALAQLKFMKKAAAEPVLKLVNSAIANAEHNFQLKRENLYIKIIMADGGPTIHRFRPRAFGRAAAIRKRTSHITLVLDELEASKPVKETKPQSEADVKKTEKAKVKVVKKPSTEKAEKKTVNKEASKSEPKKKVVKTK